MRKKSTRKRPYFSMESAMTAILRDASGKMHHGILFDRRLRRSSVIHLRATPNSGKLRAKSRSGSLPYKPEEVGQQFAKDHGANDQAAQ